jgi:hypothetical protein
MSGGSYGYQYSRIEFLAEELQEQLDTNEVIDEQRDATTEERAKIIDEVTTLVKDLKSVAFRAKEFEWYQSGDTGATSYLERLADGYR